MRNCEIIDLTTETMYDRKRKKFRRNKLIKLMKIERKELKGTKMTS